MRRKILPRKKKKRVKDKNTQSTKRVMPASSTNYLTSRYFLLNLRAKHDSCPFNSLIKKNNSTAPKKKKKNISNIKLKGLCQSLGNCPG